MRSLRRKTDIRRVLHEGRRFHSPQAVLHVRAGAEGGGSSAGPRLAVVAGRRFPNAVSRNRARRVLREASRSLLRDCGTSWDLILVARPSALEQSHGDRLGTLSGLFEEAGVLSGRGSADA